MTTTNYIWDPHCDNVLMEQDESGSTTGIYTNEPSQFGNLISQLRNGQKYFHHYDALRSTRAVTDQSENVVETAIYSALGETVAKTSSITNPFGFKGSFGYCANPEMDDFYVRARTLLPKLGRWLSADPSGFSKSDANLYLYVENQPIQHSDPSGLQRLCGTLNLTITAAIGPGAIGQNGLGCIAVTDARIRAEVTNALAAQGFPRIITNTTGCPGKEVCCPAVTVIAFGVVSFSVVVLLDLPGPNCTLTIPITITATGIGSVGYCAVNCCLVLPPIVMPPIIVPLPPHDIGTIEINVS